MSNEETPLSMGKIAALRLLSEAYGDAKDVNKTVWEFAVTLARLIQAGASEADLRWLVTRRYADHAEEITPPGHAERTFRPISSLAIPESSCFILTHAGAIFIKHRRLCGALASAAMSATVAASLGATERICWNRSFGELYIDGKLVRRFLRQATAQWAVLDAFQTANWPRRVEITLPSDGARDPAHRLREVVAELNKGLAHSPMHFRMDGSGSGVVYNSVGSGT